MKIHYIESFKYWTNYLGLARSLLALSTLSILLFNSDQTLFGELNTIYSSNNLGNFNIYIIFKDNLDIARYVSYTILLMVIIGIYPRYTAIFHWWISYSFFTSSIIIEGGDQINSNLTFLLIPILLLDKRKSHWSITNQDQSIYAKTIAFFSYILIILQVFVLYFEAGLSKLKVEEWKNGTAVYYWFSDSVFGLNEALLGLITPLLKSPIFITFTTWGAIGLELTLALSIFGMRNKKLSFIFVIIGVLLHLSFAICFGLVSFFLAMSGALILYLLAINYNFKLKFI